MTLPPSFAISQSWPMLFIESNSNQQSEFHCLYSFIACKLEDHYARTPLCSCNIEEIETIKLSEYLELQPRHRYPFLDCLVSRGESSRIIAALKKSLEWDIRYSFVRRYFVVQKKHGCEKSFLILVDDFFFAFDDSTGFIQAKVPGSTLLKFHRSEMATEDFFDNLIGEELPIQQVFFFVRRLVQLTDAKWEYDCLAKCEEQLPGANALRLGTVHLLSDVVVDLDPMNFDCISDCQVGYLPPKDKSMYSVGIKLFSHVIGFHRNDEGVAVPMIIHNGTKRASCTELTDITNFPIGGIRHSRCSSASSPSEHVEDVTAATSQYELVENVVDFASMVQLTRQYPEDMCSAIFNRRPIFNLALIPKNRLFKKYNSMKTYGKSNLDEMKNDFISLGYGELLSVALRNWAATKIPWAEGRCITIAQAQYELQEGWQFFHRKTNLAIQVTTLPGVSNTNLMKLKRSTSKELAVAFPMTLKRYLPRGHQFLVLKDDRIYVTSSTRTMSRSVAAGFKGFTIGTSAIDKSLTSESEVGSILDAAERVSGKDFYFKSFSTGTAKIPTINGMEYLLGGLLLVCTLLADRVTPTGRFRNCVMKKTEEEGAIRQKVDFDIPIPVGVASCTLARSVKQVRHAMLIDSNWKSDVNCSRPTICGIIDDDFRDVEKELVREMAQLMVG